MFVSFWKWQVISQYVFTICIKLSKEATIGLCHGTVSVRFLSTSSYAERVVNAKEFNEEFYNETFDITIHCSVQFTNLGRGPVSDFINLCCSHSRSCMSCISPAWCPEQRAKRLCKGWINCYWLNVVLLCIFLAQMLCTRGKNSWNHVSLPDGLSAYPKLVKCTLSTEKFLLWGFHCCCQRSIKYKKKSDLILTLLIKSVICPDFTFWAKICAVLVERERIGSSPAGALGNPLFQLFVEQVFTFFTGFP